MPPKLLQHYSRLGVRCPPQVTCVNTWSTELVALFRETVEPVWQSPSGGRSLLGRSLEVYS